MKVSAPGTQPRKERTDARRGFYIECGQDNTGGSSVPFPLTPALSPGEREDRRQSVGESGLLETFGSRPLLLPLPGGEGRGEGEPGWLPPYAPGTRG